MPEPIQSGEPTAADVTPVTPSADAPPETPPVAESSPAADDKQKENPFSKRISEVVQERNYWRQMALQQQQPKAPEPAPETSPADFKSLADFEYDETKYRQYLFTETEARAIKAAQKVLQEQQVS